MSVKRRDLVRILDSIYTNGLKVIPVKRHRVFDHITANALCKQAGITPKF